MPMYEVWVRLEMEGIVEADSPDEAFEIMSDDAIADGSWESKVIEIEEDENDEQT